MAAQRAELHKSPFAVLCVHSESCPDQHRRGDDPEADTDPLVNARHVHDDEHHEQGKQSSGKDEQVLALEPLELRAAANPLVDRVLCHVTGRMSVRWWRPRSGRYRHRTSSPLSLRCPGRPTRILSRPSHHRSARLRLLWHKSIWSRGQNRM